MAFQRISTSALDAVTGGKLDLPSSTIDPNACSSSNPNGERTYTQAIATANTGPSLNDRVEASSNKAMAPWTTMNGLLSGVAGMGAAAMSTARAGR